LVQDRPLKAFARDFAEFASNSENGKGYVTTLADEGTTWSNLLCSKSRSHDETLRLGRFSCGKPLAFRSAHSRSRGFASGGLAAEELWAWRKARGFPQGKRPSRIFPEL